jgi:hypothetical protein
MRKVVTTFMSTLAHDTAITRGDDDAYEFTNWSAEDQRREREEIERRDAREAGALAPLSTSARRAKLRADIARHGDAQHHEAIHAAAERIAQRARAQHPARRGAQRAAGRGRREARRSANKASASTTASSSDGGDPDPEPHGEPATAQKRKGEQTVILAKTRNKKLGKGVWASTLPVRQTCPPSCPFLNNGCYGQRGPGGHVARLERNADRERLTALDIAREEARLILQEARRRFSPGATRGSSKHPALRLHVSGDSAVPEAARIVSAACEEWSGPIWGYTHCHSDVPRDAWGSVSMLASVETVSRAAIALARGYAVARAMAEFPTGKTPWVEGGITWIPCPAQTRKTTCADCRLCWDDKELIRRNQGIAFAGHGSGARKVRETLIQLRKKDAPSADAPTPAPAGEQ